MRTLIPLAVAAALLPGAAHAIEPAWLGARAGTLGVGAEAGVRIVPTVVVRGIIQGLERDDSRSIDGIGYSSTVKLGSIGAQVDFRPPLVPLFVSAGIYANSNEISLTATPATSFAIGGTTYSAAQVGSLRGNATFNDQALYGGLGLEFSVGPLAGVLEAGLFYQGDPNVVMTATGPIASNPGFIADLNRETAAITDKLDNAKYWPAITVQARWKF